MFCETHLGSSRVRALRPPQPIRSRSTFEYNWSRTSRKLPDGTWTMVYSERKLARDVTIKMPFSVFHRVHGQQLDSGAKHNSHLFGPGALTSKTANSFIPCRLRLQW